MFAPAVLAGTKRRLRLCTAIVSLASLVPAAASAQSLWNGAAGDNDFANGGNWSSDPNAPGVSDNASIGTGTPTVSGDVAVGSVDVSGGTLQIDADLSAAGGTRLSDPGRISVSTGGSLTSDVDMTGGHLGISGTLDGNLVSTGGEVINDGTITGETRIDGADLTNSGSLRDLIISSGSSATNNGAGIVSGTTTIGDGSLTNGGTLNSADVGSSGHLINNSTGTITAVTNAGETSNAGTIGSLTNTGGTFSNNDGGTITGRTVITGGTVTNNFVVTDVDVAAAAIFVNNSGATAGAVTNAGEASNAGTITSLTNTGGTFSNNDGGTITGRTVITGGAVTNNFVVSDVDVAAAASFVNNRGATAGAVTNSGTSSNAGTVASLANSGGTFLNDGTITGATVITGGAVTNSFAVTDVDVAAAASFVNNRGATAGLVTNAGASSNDGTVASLVNSGGTFLNDGRITGSTTVSAGAVTNNFVVTDVDVAAAAAFINNTGAVAGALTNAGTSLNAGEIASLANMGGTFINNAGGTITGRTTVTGGTVVNNFVVTEVDVAEAATFVNNATGIAGTVTNAGTSSNSGRIASLVNTGGIFANTGTIAGDAAITGGTFINDGTVAGAVDIGADGTLSGTGEIGGLVVGRGGRLSPGPGIATVSVAGDVTFEKGSVFEVETDASGLNDRLDADGAVTLKGGRVEVLAGNGTYSPATTYTILTGDHVTGAFNDVTTDLAFLSPVLTYGDDEVTLGLYRNDVDFADVADTANTRATAGSVRSLGADNPVFLGVLPLDAEGARDAFSQLSGELHASLKSQILQDSRLARDAVIDRMSGALSTRQSADSAASFWMTGVAATGRIDGDGNAAGIDSHSAGVLAGVDGELGDHWRLGGLLGYTNASAGRDADWDSFHAGLYTAAEWGGLSFTGGGIYSRQDVSTRRRLSFGMFEDDLKASYGSSTRQVFADLSWKQRAGPLTLAPFANIAYVNLDTDGFREKGGAAALSSSGRMDDIVATTLGLRWSAETDFDEMPVTLSGMLGWRRAIGDLTPSSRFAFASGSPFVIEGVSMPRDAAVVGASVAARLSKSARLRITYSGEFSHAFTAHAAKADLVVNF